MTVKDPNVTEFEGYTLVEHYSLDTGGKVLFRGDKCGKSYSTRPYEFYSFVEIYGGDNMETVERSWVNLILDNAFVSVFPEEVRLGPEVKRRK